MKVNKIVNNLKMAITEKVKLSSNFIFTKIICLIGVVITFTLIFDQNNTDPDFDLKTNLEYKLYFLVLTALTIYFFTRPNISHDDSDLYIKKIFATEIVIPLKNIKTILYNPFAFRRGGYVYSIEYFLNSKEENSIKFYLQYNFLNRMKEFINLVKVHNPKVEII